MANVCKRCKRASFLSLVKGEMLCDHCSPMKGLNDYHKKLIRLKSLKNDKSTVAKAKTTKSSTKTNSQKTSTIKQPQTPSASVERAKQVAQIMKTVVKKSK